MTTSAPETAEAGTSPEHTPTPLLAVLGAGDAAVAAVARAFADASAAAAGRRQTVQQRVADLTAEFESLRSRLSGEELRRALTTYRAQVERAYAQFAGRGEQTWDRLREKPQVRHALTALETYSEKLDARVDDAQEAAARALAAASRRTRVAGEKVALTGQRLSGRAADAVVDVSATASEAVEEAGTTAAQVIEETGDEAAAATRAATSSAEKATEKATGNGGGKATPKRATRRPAAQ